MVTTIIVVIVVTIIVSFLLYRYAGTTQGSSSNTSKLVGTAIDGKTQFDSNISLPVSSNEPEGMTFSYTAWLRIEDFAYRYGEEKVIFTKGTGSLSTMCPGVFLDANTNTILVKLDTYGAREIVPISNIPAKKWFHLAIAVDQDSMDVYINGIIHTHKSLSQLPRQNSSTIHTGVGGGFDGKISSLIYYYYFLKNTDIPAIMGVPPEVEKDDSSTSVFQDISFWTRA